MARINYPSWRLYMSSKKSNKGLPTGLQLQGSAMVTSYIRLAIVLTWLYKNKKTYTKKQIRHKNKCNATKAVHFRTRKPSLNPCRSWMRSSVWKFMSWNQQYKAWKKRSIRIWQTWLSSEICYKCVFSSLKCKPGSQRTLTRKFHTEAAIPYPN